MGKGGHYSGGLSMRSFKEAFCLVAIAVVCGGIAYFIHPRAPSFGIDKLERQLEEVQGMAEVFWVDARADEDFERAHLDGAISLNIEHWEEQLVDFLDRWPPDATTIVYCSSLACMRSHEIVERLREELGIEEVYVLKGGWESLLEAGIVEEGGS